MNQIRKFRFFPVLQVIDTVNEYLAKGLAAHFEKAQESLDKASPELAAHLNETLAKVHNKLQGMPGSLGYMENAGACLVCKFIVIQGEKIFNYPWFAFSRAMQPQLIAG